MQFIKSRADELAILRKPMDEEIFIKKILDVLDDYKPIVDVINGMRNTNSFDELHEKLINKELNLHHSLSSVLSFHPPPI